MWRVMSEAREPLPLPKRSLLIAEWLPPFSPVMYRRTCRQKKTKTPLDREEAHVSDRIRSKRLT